MVSIPEEDLPPNWEEMSDRQQMNWYGRYMAHKPSETKPRKRNWGKST